MSALTHLLLIAAALSLWSSVAIAKDIPGLPKELDGAIFAETPEDCRTYFNSFKTGRIQNHLVTAFGRTNGIPTFGGDCNVTPCFAEILSYRTVKNGYVVKMRWIGSGSIEHLSATRRDGNKFRFQFLPGEAIRNHIRCPRPE